MEISKYFLALLTGERIASALYRVLVYDVECVNWWEILKDVLSETFTSLVSAQRNEVCFFAWAEKVRMILTLVFE